MYLRFQIKFNFFLNLIFIFLNLNIKYYEITKIKNLKLQKKKFEISKYPLFEFGNTPMKIKNIDNRNSCILY